MNSELTDRDYFLETCQKTDQWLFMGSPWPMTLILISYLAFVLKIGPEFMKDRKPFQLKLILLVYNLLQTVISTYIVLQLFLIKGAVTYLRNHSCHPMDPRKNPNWEAFNSAVWMFLVSKMIDLFDTIFYVLRKKYSNISFLHVYHHANMVAVVWFFLKYIKGEQAVIVGVVNSFVHTIMYTYYFLAALGPSIQKYLWWKKYITQLQMLQFLMYFIYMAFLMSFNCPLPRGFSVFVIIQSVIFFGLFLNFYVRAYRSSIKPIVPHEKIKKEE